MKQKIFLIILILLLSVFGVSIYNEFMANHTYYQGMLASWTNRKLVLRAIVAVAIPLLYIVRGKVFSVKRFFLYYIPTSLLVYTTAFVMSKDAIIGWSAWWIILMVNTLLIYFLGVYAVLGFTALGTWISKTRIKFKEIRRQEMVINFGIGLGIFLLLIYILSMLTMLRGILIWAIFIGLGFMIRYMKQDMLPYQNILSDITQQFKKDALKEHRWKRIGLLLLAISLIYYMYGFQLSIIPYSTAWDANHAYMYIPKVLAENTGVLRGNMWAAGLAPELRHVFITFRFSLITPIKSWFWMSPDNVAVAMNFLSGIFVLIFGTGLIREVLQYFSTKTEDAMVSSIGFYSGWMMLLFRLTSGMGAFLVFVDNKTDLGIMALTILAMLSGFIFLKYVMDNREHGLKLHRDSLKYIIISWAMFAWALMAKPTAFIDVAMFGLLLIGLWINSIVAIGAGLMVVGITGVLKIANAPDMINPTAGMYLVGIGALIALFGIVYMVLQKKRNNDTKRLLKYIAIWGATIVAVLLVFKWPNIMIHQLLEWTFTPSNFIKRTLLVQQETPLLLATADAEELDMQNTVDKKIIDSTNLSPEQCAVIEFTEDDLKEGMREAVVTNEDVGRYVGYGRKEITKWWWLNLWYGMLRMLYIKDYACYGINAQAKLLCKNAQAIDSFDVPTLQNLLTQLQPNKQWYMLVADALDTYKEKGVASVVNPAEYRDHILAIRQYYQNHAIFTEKGKIHVPYRYLVPFNVTFNRSLQNLSSYYTDIGFVWLMILGMLLIGFVYSIAYTRRFTQDAHLFTLIAVTILGRAIWWMIGWAILRYAMGLIVWTIIAVALVIKYLFAHCKDDNEKTMMYIILFLFAIRALIQFVLNFVRISSQWGGGPFLRYRMNHGKNIEITTTLQQKEVVTPGYGRKDVFDLQFPHYNKFIDHTKTRKNDEGVLIAGTYLQYFLHNQRNILMDGMLAGFREQASDGNLCKTYQRLQNKKIKYLVIDPNIGTVVMGEWNESLFNRFFAKKDPVTGKIQDDGAISMLAKLRDAGYISLFWSNNLGAKYAFTISDEAIKAKFGAMSYDEMIFFRAKLSIARFFSDAQELVNFIGETFTQRVKDGKAIGDIADVYGKTIDEEKVYAIANVLVSNPWDPEKTKTMIETLTQDERIILMQYAGLVNLLQTNNPKYSEFLNNIIGQSLGGGSQLIVFELN